MSDSQQLLLPTECWHSAVKVLCALDVDVQIISDKDFENGDLVLRPPTIRVMYASTSYKSVEYQHQVYEATHRFLAICGDSDLRGTEDQAHASLRLAQKAAFALAGARLKLPTGELTEPIGLLGIEPMEVQGFGVAYAVAFEAPGPTVFPAPNAYPNGENNG